MSANGTHIHTGDGLRYANGDRQLYLELLRLFGENKAKRQRELEITWQSIVGRLESDESLEALWESAVIQVHDLKGEARGIGAAALGGLLYGLELAFKERDRAKAEALFPVVKKEWREVALETRRLIDTGTQDAL